MKYNETSSFKQEDICFTDISQSINGFARIIFFEN